MQPESSILMPKVFFFLFILNKPYVFLSRTSKLVRHIQNCTFQLECYEISNPHPFKSPGCQTNVPVNWTDFTLGFVLTVPNSPFDTLLMHFPAPRVFFMVQRYFLPPSHLAEEYSSQNQTQIVPSIAASLPITFQTKKASTVFCPTS